MWTSSYLPGRLRLLALLGMAALAVLSAALLLLLRCSKGPQLRMARPDPTTVRLHVEGTPGACLRVSGGIVGPLPLSLSLPARAPRRLFLSACRGGHADAEQVLLVRPGEQVRVEMWLPAAQGGGVFSYRHPCPCER